MSVTKFSVVALTALTTVSAQAINTTTIESFVNGFISQYIPGGLATLTAVGISLPSIPGSVTNEANTLLAGAESNPIVLGGLNSILNGQIPSISSIPISVNNITSYIPPACEQAIYNATASRSDCGPLYNILYSNNARQNQTAVAEACSVQYSGCIAAVEQAIEQNLAVCEAYINYGVPGFNAAQLNYLNLIVEGGCTTATINGTETYCLPIWDTAATEIASNGVTNAELDSLCNQPCRDALASNLVNNQQFGVSAPTAVHYADILNAACAVNPATENYCVNELQNNTGANYAYDASKFCTPCARIEMALGQKFTTVSQSTYNHVVEEIEAYACATDVATGELCSDVIYNNAISASSDLNQFITNTTLLEVCALNLLQAHVCPTECAAPLQAFINGLGSCGGLLLSNTTLAYASSLPAPFNAYIGTIVEQCNLQPVAEPVAQGTVIANIIASNTTETGRLTALLNGNYQNSDILDTLNYPYATVTKLGTQYNFTGITGLSTGLIAQRITDAIYQGVFGNQSTVYILPFNTTTTPAAS